MGKYSLNALLTTQSKYRFHHHPNLPQRSLFTEPVNPYKSDYYRAIFDIFALGVG